MLIPISVAIVNSDKVRATLPSALLCCSQRQPDKEMADPN
jgi:hypothetical protein